MVLVKRTLKGLGDLLMALPALQSLAKDNVIILQVLPEYCEFFGRFPFLQVTSKHQDIKQFDQVFDLNTACIQYEQLSKTPPNRIDLIANLFHVEPTEIQIPLIEKDFKIEVSKNKNVFLHIIGSDPKRSWPLQNYIALIEGLKDFPITFYVSDDQYREWLYPNVRVVKDLSIGEIAALISRCDLFIGPDSGLMHLAGLLKIPGFVFFGSTHPESRLSYYPSLSPLIDRSLECLSCLHPDEQILMSDGSLKPIKEVSIGDLVLDKHGIPALVKHVQAHSLEEDVLEVKVKFSNQPFFITGNHRVPIYRDGFMDLTIKDLKVRDKMLHAKALLRGSGTLDGFYLGADHYWLLGVLISRCLRRRGRYEIILRSSELLEKVMGLLASLQISYERSSDGLRISPGEQLGELLGPIATRHVPLEVLSDNREYLEQFVRGIYLGCPHPYGATNRFAFDVLSESLAVGLRYIFTMFNGWLEITKHRQINFPNPDKTYWTLTMPMERMEKEFSFLNISTMPVADDFVLVPITQIRHPYQQPAQVYDLHIESSESYNMRGISIYNCWYKPCHNNLKCMTNIPALQVADHVLQKLGKSKAT